MKSLDDLRKRLMKNEAFRREYESRKPIVDLANEFIRLRTQQGLTRQDIARTTHVPEKIIAQFEEGDMNLPIGIIAKLVSGVGGKLTIKEVRQ